VTASAAASPRATRDVSVPCSDSEDGDDAARVGTFASASDDCNVGDEFYDSDRARVVAVGDEAVGGRGVDCLVGGPYSGAWIETYEYGSGWPPTRVLASWPTPFRYEYRALFPKTAGAWASAGSVQNTDRATWQNIYELDVAEERTTFPTEIGFHQHTWASGRDIAVADGWAVASDIRFNWHTVSVAGYNDRTEYRVDGDLRATLYGVAGRFGAILHNGIAPPGSWGSGGAHPDPSDPGPWDLLVDYVRVTAL
jgi:hypothetical protein